MIRKLASSLFAAAVLLGVGIRANAAETGGTVRVSLDAGELPVTNGAITLYQVGTPVTDGYRITEGFGGGIVKSDDATSPYLAQWLAESAGEAGKTVNLDVDGNVTFSNLENGLYLIVQTERMDGFYPIKPFLVTIPDDGQWQVQVSPKTEPIIIENLENLENPQTGQPIAPLLGAMGLVASGVGLYLCVDSKRRK